MSVDLSNKSSDSNSTIEKCHFVGQDNHAFKKNENFKRNLNHIACFESNDKNNAKLLKFSSISTWTCGNNEYASEKKLHISPSLQDVFQK